MRAERTLRKALVVATITWIAPDHPQIAARGAGEDRAAAAGHERMAGAVALAMRESGLAD